MELAEKLAWLGEGNPQFWRECKGRLKPINGIAILVSSLVAQILVYIYFSNRLPDSVSYRGTIATSRYCTGGNADGYSLLHTCIRDLNGDFIIFKQLWWLDISRCLSYGLVVSLLVLGTYSLILDLTKEENQGTLNFIRLSPQSAKAIFLGKLLGVPILLYLGVLAAIPLHTIASLRAGIPLGLILAFYAVLGASCVFFYHLALVIALSSAKISNFAAALVSSGIAMYLCLSSLFSSNDPNPFHWLALFNPLWSFSYLVKSTFIPEETHRYYGLATNNLLWYNEPVFRCATIGIMLIILHYGFWSYWLSQAIYRRFTNPLSPFLGKVQSYWITGVFTIIGLGFVLSLSTKYDYDYDYLRQNFGVFQVFCFVFIMLLTLAISPRRQHLLDWSRYHHQHLLRSLIVGEKSPGTVAIALNLLIIVLMVVPAILASPLQGHKLATLFSFLAGINMTLIYAVLTQWILMGRRVKQGLIALGITGGLTLLPLVLLAVLATMSGNTHSISWLFSVVPSLAGKNIPFPGFAWAIFTQWIGLTFLGLGMGKQLRKAGMSTTKALMGNS